MRSPFAGQASFVCAFRTPKGSVAFFAAFAERKATKDAEWTVVISAWEIESLHAEREEYAAGRHFYVVGPSWAAGTSACRCADGTVAQDKCMERFSTLHGQS